MLRDDDRARVTAMLEVLEDSADVLRGVASSDASDPATDLFAEAAVIESVARRLRDISSRVAALNSPDIDWRAGGGLLWRAERFDDEGRHPVGYDADVLGHETGTLTAHASADREGAWRGKLVFEISTAGSTDSDAESWTLFECGPYNLGRVFTDLEAGTAACSITAKSLAGANPAHEGNSLIQGLREMRKLEALHPGSRRVSQSFLDAIADARAASDQDEGDEVEERDDFQDEGAEDGSEYDGPPGPDHALGLLIVELRERHLGSLMPDDLVAALREAMHYPNPPMIAVLEAYQPLTDLNLKEFLRRHGLDPDDFE